MGFLHPRPPLSGGGGFAPTPPTSGPRWGLPSPRPRASAPPPSRSLWIRLISAGLIWYRLFERMHHPRGSKSADVLMHVSSRGALQRQHELLLQVDSAAAAEHVSSQTRSRWSSRILCAFSSSSRWSPATDASRTDSSGDEWWRQCGGSAVTAALTAAQGAVSDEEDEHGKMSRFVACGPSSHLFTSSDESSTSIASCDHHIMKTALQPVP